MAEILASIDDINAELPSDDEQPVVVVDDDDVDLLQTSVARVVRAQLSRVIDRVTLATWTVPDNTPEIVRVIAGKLIAAQFYFNRMAGQTTEISDTSFAQKRYNEAMALITGIIDGEITIDGVTVEDTETLTDLDYFPVDATDRSFTKSRPF